MSMKVVNTLDKLSMSRTFCNRPLVNYRPVFQLICFLSNEFAHSLVIRVRIFLTIQDIYYEMSSQHFHLNVEIFQDKL